MPANYRWLRSLVKHIVTATHGSSQPLTSNELWLLELWIKSTRKLAPIPDALWDMCKSSIAFQNLTQYKDLAVRTTSSVVKVFFKMFNQ